MSSYGQMATFQKRTQPSDAYVNTWLTDFSVGMVQKETAFVASRVFPVRPHAQQTAEYLVYDMADWNRDSMKRRAPSTESEGDGFVFAPEPYYCPVYALHRDIDDQYRSNAASPPIIVDQETTRFLNLKNLIRREVSFASGFFTPGVWTNEVTGNAAAGAGQFVFWDDYVNSTPIEDLRAGIQSVHLATGFKPNVLVLSAPVWAKLVDHPAILDRVRAGQTPGGPAMVMRSDVAAILEIERIEVMDAVVNTADVGMPAQNGYIGGEHAALFHVAPQLDLLSPSAGATFTWSGYPGANEDGVRITEMRLDLTKSDRFEIESSFVHKKTGDSLGYFFANALSP